MIRWFLQAILADSSKRLFPQTNKKTFADLLAKIDAGKTRLFSNKLPNSAGKVNLTVKKYSRAGGICQSGCVIKSLKLWLPFAMPFLAFYQNIELQLLIMEDLLDLIALRFFIGRHQPFFQRRDLLQKFYLR